MIQVVPKDCGLPVRVATQVSIDVMTFNTEAPNFSTHYKVCDADGKVLQSGNYAIDTYAALHSFSQLLTEIEDAVLNYLTLVRE